MSFIRNIAEQLVDAKNPTHQAIRKLTKAENEKRPTRTEVINHVLEAKGIVQKITNILASKNTLEIQPKSKMAFK